MTNLPLKLRDIRNHHMDSTVWDEFLYRPDDIIIASYIKSGTTWLQQIIGQLVFGGEENLPIAKMSPWLDLRFPPKEAKLSLLENQTHRRFVKTHLPADALVFSDEAKYLYIARDGRDVVWSMHPHYSRGNEFMYRALNETTDRFGPPLNRPTESITQYFTEWLDDDGYPIWSFWENVQTWWNLRKFPNVKLLHYNNLKEDLGREIRTIADFLEISVVEDKFEEILQHCSFDYMKRNAKQVVPLEGKLWEGGAKTFVHKGTNNRWRDHLIESESLRYESMARMKLGEECASWLATGK